MIQYPFDLPTVWFLLVGVLLTGYAILDGFDLGVGALHLFAKKDEHRRIMLNSIGPVWDGNEVWLLVGGGALFAAFPDVYATVFSGFYLALMLLLAALIFRAVAIEFRSKLPGTKWRHGWDIAFSVASILIPVLTGVALGNIVVGIQLDANYEYTGTFFDLLNPFSLILGITTLALFVMHGSIYLTLKTEGELREMAQKWVKGSIAFFMVMFVVLTAGVFIFAPNMAARFTEMPWLAVLPVLVVLAILNVPREIHHKREGIAFFSSSCVIAGLLALFGIGKYPFLVPSTVNPEVHSLTIRNAASSQTTLAIMLTIALIGVPFVLAYTASIYWVFRGKVDTAHMHY